MLAREEVGGTGKFEGEVAASKVSKLLVLIKKQVGLMHVKNQKFSEIFEARAVLFLL